MDSTARATQGAIPGVVLFDRQGKTIVSSDPSEVFAMVQQLVAEQTDVKAEGLHASRGTGLCIKVAVPEGRVGIDRQR